MRLWTERAQWISTSMYVLHNKLCNSGRCTGAQVALLFRAHRDLLEEFTYFLPDSSPPQQLQQVTSACNKRNTSWLCWALMGHQQWGITLKAELASTIDPHCIICAHFHMGCTSSTDRTVVRQERPRAMKLGAWRLLPGKAGCKLRRAHCGRQACIICTPCLVASSFALAP